MSDYTLRFTDPAHGSVLVKPYTTNGSDTPRSVIPFDSSAISSDTSLVFLGKGLPDYGSRIQEGLLHLLENFAYKSRPANPVQGQMWYKNVDFSDPDNVTDPLVSGLYMYDGAAWNAVAISGIMSDNFDVNGVRLTNVANPVDPGDAVNKQYMELSFVQTAGGTMTGELIVPSIVVNGTGISMSSLPITDLATPLLGTDAANKQYVDTAVIVGLGGGTAYLPLTGGTLTGGLTLSSADFNVINAAVSFSDVAITASNANVVLDGTSSFAFAGTTFDMTGRRITNVPLVPSAPADAASKSYVDTSLARAATYHARDILMGDGATTTFSLNTSYVVGSHELDVYNNGVKQYMSQSAQMGVAIDAAAADTLGYHILTMPLKKSAFVTSDVMVDFGDTAIAAAATATYYFKVAVDGGAAIEYYINTPDLVDATYVDLAALLDGAFRVGNASTLNADGVDVMFDDTHDRFVFSRTLPGLSYSVVVSAGTTGTDVFAQIVTDSTPTTMTYSVDSIALIYNVEPSISLNYNVNVDGSDIIGTLVNVAPYTSFTGEEIAFYLDTTLTAVANVYWDATTSRLIATSKVPGTNSSVTFTYPDIATPNLFDAMAATTTSVVDFDPPVQGTDGVIDSTSTIYLAPGAYTLNVQVNGTSYSIGITTVSPVLSLYDILLLIRASITTAGAPVVVHIVENTFVFQTTTYGGTGLVYLTSETLFTAISAALTTTHAVSYIGSTLPVLTATDGPFEFSVTGNYTSVFTTGVRFVVSGSTGNDSTYTVVSSSFGAGDTTIVVSETITSGVDDGMITVARTLAYTEVGTLYGESSVIEFVVAPAALDVIEVKTTRTAPV